MTQKIQWGPAIAVDGKRPEWLDLDQKILPIVPGKPELVERLAGNHVWDLRGVKTTQIHLPADHPYYRQTEAAPVDWSGELEAVHEDGRVVRVRLSEGEQPDHDHYYSLSEFLDTGGAAGKYFKADGSMSYNIAGYGRPWRIRNVLQPTPQADTRPDLTARMEALELARMVAEWPVQMFVYNDTLNLMNEARQKALAIVALLPEPEAVQSFDVPRAPCMTISEVREMVAKGEDAVIATMLERGYALPEPVDEDLIEAREMEAEACEANGFPEYAAKVRAGEEDNGTVRLRYEGIKRGRALALAGEKEA